MTKSHDTKPFFLSVLFNLIIGTPSCHTTSGRRVFLVPFSPAVFSLILGRNANPLPDHMRDNKENYGSSLSVVCMVSLPVPKSTHYGHATVTLSCLKSSLSLSATLMRRNVVASRVHDIFLSDITLSLWPNVSARISSAQQSRTTAALVQMSFHLIIVCLDIFKFAWGYNSPHKCGNHRKPRMSHRQYSISPIDCINGA